MTPAPTRLLGEDPGLLGGIALAASQTAVLTAVLYYFGWARTNATLAAFGLDPSVVGYDTTDYVLRSISVAFPTAVGTAALGLTLLATHRLAVVPALRGPRRSRARRVTRAGVLGLHLLAVAAAGVLAAAVLRPTFVAARLGIGVPLIVTGLAVLFAYLGHLRRRYPHDMPARNWAGASGRAPAVLLAGLALLGAFWAAGLQADTVGRRIANDIVTGLPARPAVLLFSEHRLYLSGTGVHTTEFAEGRYRFRYAGIRTLARSDDTLLLIPVGWRPDGRDRVFVVPDDGTIRYDIGRPLRPDELGMG